MARRKIFNSYRAQEVEPIEIVLNEEVFYFRGSISGVELLEFFSQMDAENVDGASKAIWNILMSTVTDGSAGPFETYVRNPDNNVSIEMLSEMAAYILESYTGNPTDSSQESSDGSAANGPGLTAVPSDPGSTFDS